MSLISNQKIFNYFKEDVRSLNNPFSAVSYPEDFHGNIVDTRFLSYKKHLTKLRVLGLRRDPRR